MCNEAEPAVVIVDDEGRPEPPLVADEADTLLGFLEFQRATFEWKTRDLTVEQFRHRLQHPSTMTLAGIMKHLAFVEEYARHNGHADLLREAVDGQTGE